MKMERRLFVSNDHRPSLLIRIEHERIFFSSREPSSNTQKQFVRRESQLHFLLNFNYLLHANLRLNHFPLSANYLGIPMILKMTISISNVLSDDSRTRPLSENAFYRVWPSDWRESRASICSSFA